MATKRKSASRKDLDARAEQDQEATGPANIDYEKTLADLEAIVERMESEQQPLEKAVKDFERGMALSRACLTSLKHAEQRIDKLMLSDDSNDDEAGVEPFTADE